MGYKKTYDVRALRALLYYSLQKNDWPLEPAGFRALVEDVEDEYFTYQYVYKNLYHGGIRKEIRAGKPTLSKEKEYIDLLLHYAGFASLSDFLKLHPVPEPDLGLVYPKHLQSTAAQLATRLAQKGFHCMWEEQDYKTAEWEQVDQLVRGMNTWAPGKPVLLLLSWESFVAQETEGKINSSRLSTLVQEWEKDSIAVILCFTGLDPTQLSPRPGSQYHLLDGWEEDIQVLETLIKKLEPDTPSPARAPAALAPGTPTRFAHVFYSDAKRGDDFWFDLLETGSLYVSATEVRFENEERKLNMRHILTVREDALFEGYASNWLQVQYTDEDGQPAFAWFAEAPEHGQGHFAARDASRLLTAFHANHLD